MDSTNTFREIVTVVEEGCRTDDVAGAVEQLRAMDLEARNDDGETALAHFVSTGALVPVSVLLEAGASLQSGMLAALHAVNVSAYALLEQMGGRITCSDILSSASWRGQLHAFDIFRLAFEFGAVDASQHHEGKPFLHALVRYLPPDWPVFSRAMFANIDATDADGETAALLAARTGKLEVLTLLLEHGADPAIRNHAGQNVFSFPRVVSAVLFDFMRDCRHEARIVALVEAGADVAAAQADGFRLVHRCIHAQSPRVLDLLASHGADLDAMNQAGDTPLQYCAREGLETRMFQLIRLGAGVNVANARGTALSVALQRISDRDPSWLMKPMISMKFNPAVMLLMHGADPLARDSVGNLYVGRMLGATEEAILRTASRMCCRFGEPGSKTKPAREPPVKRRRGNHEVA